MLDQQYKEFTEPIRSTFNDLKLYVEEQIGFNKLVLAKKIGELSSYLALMMILAFLGVLILIFLSFAFVWWYSADNPEKLFVGYLIVAGFYALLGFIIFLGRESLIFKPFRKALGNIIFSDISSKERNETFESAEMLDARITFVKERLDQKEKDLTKKINDLGETYNMANIAKQMMRSAYSMMITTSNVAKMAFNFVQNLKRKRKTKRERERERELKKNAASEKAALKNRK